MKIVHSVESCLTGVGSHVSIICQELSKDHEVHLLYSLTRADASFRKNLSYFDSLGVHLQEIQMSRSINLVSDWKTIQAISKYIRENGSFDIYDFA